MSAGKGFGTSPMGFNKQEVNEYIASLSKRMSEIESEKKELEKKYESVKKIVDGADERAKQAETAAKERVEQLEEQIRSERKNSEELIDQIDELKRKLKNAGSNSSGSSGAGAKNIAAAEKQAEEIISSAKRTAKETVANANKTASEIVEKAKRAAAAGAGHQSADLSGFLAQLRDFADSVNSGCKALMDKVSEISENESGYSVETPDFSAFETPKSDDFETSGSELDFESNSDSGLSGGMDDFNSLIDSMSGNDSSDDMRGGFGDDMNGNFGEDMSGGFGEDMDGSMDMDFGFGSIDDMSETVSGADKNTKADFEDLDADMTLADKAPESEETDSAFDLSFGSGDMISGFDMSDNESSDDEMSGELTADFSDTVEAGDVGLKDDFDLGTDNGMDEMQKLLEQAELTFGGGSSEFEEKTADASADDWSSLQNELDALEKQNGSDGGSAQQDSIDDNSGDDIWSLGNTDMSENDDDDMSSDLFGSF